MQKWWLVLITLAFAVVIFSVPSPVAAQYPRGYNPYSYPQYYYYNAPPGPRPRLPFNPYYYYFFPDPKAAERWRRHRQWLEYQNQFRSPLNPESTLDYMLRTF
jgi:hypothetical protein